MTVVRPLDEELYEFAIARLGMRVCGEADAWFTARKLHREPAGRAWLECPDPAWLVYAAAYVHGPASLRGLLVSMMLEHMPLEPATPRADAVAHASAFMLGESDTLPARRPTLTGAFDWYDAAAHRVRGLPREWSPEIHAKATAGDVVKSSYFAPHYSAGSVVTHLMTALALDAARVALDGAKTFRERDAIIDAARFALCPAMCTWVRERVSLVQPPTRTPLTVGG